jgi:hypothetical protein
MKAKPECFPRAREGPSTGGAAPRSGAVNFCYAHVVVRSPASGHGRPRDASLPRRAFLPARSAPSDSRSFRHFQQPKAPMDFSWCQFFRDHIQQLLESRNPSDFPSDRRSPERLAKCGPNSRDFSVLTRNSPCSTFRTTPDHSLPKPARRLSRTGYVRITYQRSRSCERSEAICPSSGAERAPLFLLPGALPHEGTNEGKARMFPERNEWPSTAATAEERSGYTELYAVAGRSPRAGMDARERPLPCSSRFKTARSALSDSDLL